jgi:O-antigen/teichoic acid export membrane protein
MRVIANTVNIVAKVTGRLGWGIADQAVSSLTNFALGVAVARQVSTADLGAFFIVFTTYLVVLSLSRPVTTQPLLIRYSTVQEHEWREASRAATGTAAVIGVIAGGALVLVGWLIVGGPLGAGLIPLGLALPGLVLQETWRGVFFAGSRGQHALLNDLIWALALLGLLSLLFALGVTTTPAIVGAWGASATIAAVAGIIQAKTVPSPRLAMSWYRRGKELSIPLLGDAAIRIGAHSLSWYLIGIIAGLAAVGALKGTQLLLGPTNVIVIGVALAAVPESARNLAQSTTSLRHTMMVISSVSAASVLAWGGAVFLLPESIGRQLLGVSWSEAHSLLGPTIIAFTFSAITLGARSGLLALAESRRILLTGAIEAAILLSVVALGAAWAGAHGAAIAFAIGTGAGCALWWSQALRALRNHLPTVPASPIVREGLSSRPGPESEAF